MKKLFVLVPAFLFLVSCFAQERTSGKTSDKKAATAPVKTLNFIAMGDWGRNGEYNQKEVAIQMGITARLADVSFILATGDNFYPSGVASTQDYSWIASFENIYTAHSLQTDWYVALGNHDYKGNVQAEIDYSKISRRWHMPARYYAKKFAIGKDTTQQVLLVCLDTSPFISQYYSSPDHREEIKGQDTAAQKKWLESVLSDPSPNIKWKIVAGHHPLYTGGNRMESPDADELNKTLKPIFDKYKVDAYICGHEHNLQYMKPEGATHYFVSGAGSETTPCILYPGIGKFAKSINGFMIFSLSANEMYVQMVDLDGNFLYRESIKK
jgi:tartrate-resistant acid phosphatase type 5